MREVGFDSAFMFKYSERPGTYAAKKLQDDVPEEVKSRRLQEIIDLQLELSRQSNERDLGKEFVVLVEGVSKKSREQLFGRNEQNKVIIFDKNNQFDFLQLFFNHCRHLLRLSITKARPIR